MRDTFSQFVRLGIIILLVCLALYWADSAYFSERRLPPCVQEELKEHHICYATLREQWGDKVIWIDARSASDFEVSRLKFPKARMFPIRPKQKEELMSAAMNRLVEASDNGECIVVFCNNTCTDSDDIANALREEGDPVSGEKLIDAPIYVLEGGWQTLEKAGVAKH